MRIIRISNGAVQTRSCGTAGRPRRSRHARSERAQHAPHRAESCILNISKHGHDSASPQWNLFSSKAATQFAAGIQSAFQENNAALARTINAGSQNLTLLHFGSSSHVQSRPICIRHGLDTAQDRPPTSTIQGFVRTHFSDTLQRRTDFAGRLKQAVRPGKYVTVHGVTCDTTFHKHIPNGLLQLAEILPVPLDKAPEAVNR